LRTPRIGSLPYVESEEQSARGCAKRAGRFPSVLPNGKYQVHIAVEAKKYRSDGRGQEHRIPLHDLIDVGVLDADGNYLYLRKRKIEQEQQEFTVTVDKIPSQAGIDPLIKLIDRNPDDNLAKVKKQ